VGLCGAFQQNPHTMKKTSNKVDIKNKGVKFKSMNIKKTIKQKGGVKMSEQTIDKRFVCKSCSMVTKSNGYCNNGHKVVSSRALLKSMFFDNSDNINLLSTNNGNFDDSNSLLSDFDEAGYLLDALVE